MPLSLLLLVALFLLVRADYQQGATDDDYVASLYASGVNGARGLVLDERGDILVLARDRSDGPIVALYENVNSDVPKQVTIVSDRNLQLSHGIAIYEDYLYASSDTTVYRWRYQAGQRRRAGRPERVVQNMNADGRGGAPQGHKTRTLIFDSDGMLYISVGSLYNVDNNAYRSRIRRFDIKNDDDLPYNFQRGEIFADGLRNEVGLAFDSRRRLWGVENSADNLKREDLGGDIHNDNPAEELNLFDGEVGTFYGYPYCWTEYTLDGGDGRGSQWAWPNLTNTEYKGEKINDDWCRNEDNNRPPELALPAHSAPLGITFYDGIGCEGETAFPCILEGNAYVAMHGSWNRDEPDGYKVIQIAFDKGTATPTGFVADVLWQADLENRCLDNGRANCMRPVNAIFKNGIMYVSSDATGEIIRVQRREGAAGNLPGEDIRKSVGHKSFASIAVMLFNVILGGFFMWLERNINI